MGLTSHLQLRRSADVVELDADGNTVLDENGDAIVTERVGRWRVLGRFLPERHQVTLTLFSRFLADGQVNGNVVEFDAQEGGTVRYRVLPPGPDQPNGVLDLVLVGSSADTPDAVGGAASFEAWRGEAVTYADRADHVGV
jgi:hypothetical protein